LPLHQRTGADVFQALYQGATATLLESQGVLPGAEEGYSICAGPPRRIAGTPQVWTPVLGQILPTLRQWVRPQPGSASAPDWIAKTSEIQPDPDLPFLGGWLGWLGYDLAWEIEQLPILKVDPLPFPVAYWYEPATFAVLDHAQQRLWLAALNPPDLDRMQQALTEAVNPMGDRPLQPHRVQLSWDQAAFEQAVQTAQAYIRAGDVFQVNLSLRFETATPATPWQVYRTLRQINPSPFASYWQTPWGAVVSCSPERLVQLRGRQAQTRPIAGTRPRGLTPAQDQQLAAELLSNRKERAEHIMLVDLERNDLGRVCQWGSVQVNELMGLERYSHVMHLVSNVVGTLRADCSVADLVAAMFPGGTITGCPKVRCMEIIEELEPLRRSLFYGSCGYLDWRGNLDLNIFIRTLLMAPIEPSPTATYQVWGQVGAGIVADSDPGREWLESLQKARAQLLSLGL
jgi:para-aminobenzoate synthetase component 1